ncbi:unnamed protein product [Cunninghamella blakesleeana]
MDTSYQQLNDSLPQQNQKTFILTDPVDPSIIPPPQESIQQDTLEGWKMAGQQRVSSYTEGWRKSQQQVFKKPKPLPNVPLQHCHSMPPGDYYQNNIYYDQYQQQQYHYSYQSPTMYSANGYFESSPNLVNEPYYTATAYDPQQQHIYPYQQQQQQQYQTDDYFNHTSTLPPLPPPSLTSSNQYIPYYDNHHHNNNNNNFVYDEPPSLLPTPPSLVPSSSTTTSTPVTSPLTPIPTTNDKPILSPKSSSPTTTTNTNITTNNNNNNNKDAINKQEKDKNQTSSTSKNKKSIPTKSSFSPLDNRTNMKQITVKSVNKEFRVWIDLLPTETGLSLADKIHHIATFRTKKVTKITTNHGRVIPLDARPIFGNWMDMSTFKNGDFWDVEWCEPDKSPMDKFISKWLNVGHHRSAPAKNSKPSSSPSS